MTLLFLRRVVAAVAAASLALASPPAKAAYSSGVIVTRLEDPRILESSGVAASNTPGVIYTHNDSGDGPYFYAISLASGRTLARYDVTDAVAFDWEDMARGPGSTGGTSLWLGDIGDNLLIRDQIVIYEVAEPDVDTSSEGLELSAPLVRAWHLAYPDVAHDAESILAIDGGRLAIVTKERSGLSHVYEATLDPAAERITMRHIATIPIAAFSTKVSANALGGLQATGAAMSPDGSKVVVRTYIDALEWPVVGGDLATAFASIPERTKLETTVQGEGITYAADGASLLTTTEGGRSPVHRYAAT
ncbi:MAG TPA: hypothetical protein VMY34_07310 [Acidimicrobiales bacterium]|nr:hypothetical protein [Acidimicrobiales bacterium]